MMNKFILVLLALIPLVASAVVQIAPSPRLQYVDGNGDPCSGCLLYSFQAGTTTPQTTFRTSLGDVANANPIVLNSSGFSPNGIWLTEGQDYKFTLSSAADVPIWTEDNINGVNDSSITVDQWQLFGGAPVFINTTTFTLSGDQTDIFHPRRRLLISDTSGEDVGTIVSSVFTSLTTVTVSLDDGAVLDSGLSQVQYGVVSAQRTSLPQIFNQTVNVSSSGTDTLTLDPMPAYGLYEQGLLIAFKAGGTNTGAVTLNVNGLGAQDVVNPDGSALAGGTITSGRMYVVVHDGTNFVLVSPSSSTPTGTVTMYAGATAPAGWFLCDGKPVSRTTFANLFTVVGDQYGIGDGSTTFNVPDLRGEFVRGSVLIEALTFTADDTTEELTTASDHEYYRTGIPVRVSTTTTLPAGLSSGTTYYTIYVDGDEVQLATSYANALAGTAINITSPGSGTHTITQYLDPDAATRSDSGDGSSGDVIGSRQEDEFESHTHTGRFSTGIENLDNNFNRNNINGNAITSSGATGGNETRPRNVGLNYIIKF